MTTVGVRTLDASLETTKEWLREVQDQMGLEDEQQAFRIVRAVLQTLRDRLTVVEAAHFASQLPMLLQGVYYHGWTPSHKPVKIRSREDFLEQIAEDLMQEHDPEEACRTVFKMIERKMPAGQIEDIKNVLPQPIRDLWP
jgi:uncharacterized protein (DUF2267 family)